MTLRRLLTGLCAAAILLFGGAACSRLPDVALPGSGSGDMRALVENRTWISTDDDAPKGSLRAFLSDGTLVMTSCGEVYRLAPWRWVEGARLVWEEDGRMIRGEVVVAEHRTLVLAVEVGGETVTQSYRAASPPEVCPDLR